MHTRLCGTDTCGIQGPPPSTEPDKSWAPLESGGVSEAGGLGCSEHHCCWTHPILSLLCPPSCPMSPSHSGHLPSLSPSRLLHKLLLVGFRYHGMDPARLPSLSHLWKLNSYLHHVAFRIGPKVLLCGLRVSREGCEAEIPNTLPSLNQSALAVRLSSFHCECGSTMVL